MHELPVTTTPKPTHVLAIVDTHLITGGRPRAGDWDKRTPVGTEFTAFVAHLAP